MLWSKRTSPSGFSVLCSCWILFPLRSCSFSEKLQLSLCPSHTPLNMSTPAPRAHSGSQGLCPPSLASSFQPCLLVERIGRQVHIHCDLALSSRSLSPSACSLFSALPLTLRGETMTSVEGEEGEWGEGERTVSAIVSLPPPATP